MSASQRVQVLTSKSSELDILAEFIKNPNLIAELSAEVLKLNSLTEVEEKKVQDAKAFMQNHANLLADLKSKEDDLAQRKAEHEASVNQFLLDTQGIRDLDIELKNKAIAQADMDKKHAEIKRALDDREANLLRQNEQERSKLSDEREQNNRDKKYISEEKARLKEYETSLKEKAKKIAELAG